MLSIHSHFLRPCTEATFKEEERKKVNAMSEEDRESYYRIKQRLGLHVTLCAAPEQIEVEGFIFKNPQYDESAASARALKPRRLLLVPYMNTEISPSAEETEMTDIFYVGLAKGYEQIEFLDNPKAGHFSTFLTKQFEDISQRKLGPIEALGSWSVAHGSKIVNMHSASFAGGTYELMSGITTALNQTGVKVLEAVYDQCEVGAANTVPLEGIGGIMFGASETGFSSLLAHEEIFDANEKPTGRFEFYSVLAKGGFAAYYNMDDPEWERQLRTFFGAGWCWTEGTTAASHGKSSAFYQPSPWGGAAQTKYIPPAVRDQFLQQGGIAGRSRITDSGEIVRTEFVVKPRPDEKRYKKIADNPLFQKSKRIIQQRHVKERYAFGSEERRANTKDLGESAPKRVRTSQPTPAPLLPAIFDFKLSGFEFGLASRGNSTSSSTPPSTLNLASPTAVNYMSTSTTATSRGFKFTETVLEPEPSDREAYVPSITAAPIANNVVPSAESPVKKTNKEYDQNSGNAQQERAKKCTTCAELSQVFPEFKFAGPCTKCSREIFYFKRNSRVPLGFVQGLEATKNVVVVAKPKTDQEIRCPGLCKDVK